jgi:hypothetical protein
MINEYDSVVLVRCVEGIPAGTSGAVLMVFDNGNAYEVEFFDGEESLGMVTVKCECLRLVERYVEK